MLILTYFALARSLGPSYVSAIYTIHDLKVKIAPLIFASSYSIFMLAIITGAIAVISVLFSHRIAGPLYRIEKNLEAIGSGDLTVNTRFRGMDQLTMLADGLNEMVRSLNHTSRSVLDALEEVLAAEDRLRTLLNMDTPSDADIKAAIEDLRQGVAEMNRALSHIKVRE